MAEARLGRYTVSARAACCQSKRATGRVGGFDEDHAIHEV